MHEDDTDHSADSATENVTGGTGPPCASPDRGEGSAPGRGSTAQPRLELPQLPLDDLLGEPQARLEVVRASRDRVHALLDAVVSIGTDLELDTVLERIVKAAVSLVGARYGALGVIADDGDRLSRFITVGLTPEEIERIGRWPTGHGILGLLIKKPYPLLLSDLSRHQDSVGFPDGHPPMCGFLGVPIRIRDEVFGNLYLTDKTEGSAFDADDQAVVTALATAAGIAIDNARLFQQAGRRQVWQHALTQISTALLTGTPGPQVQQLIADSARDITGADLAVIWAPPAGHNAASPGPHLVCRAASGLSAELYLDLRLPITPTDEDEPDRGPLSARVYRTGRSLLVEDAREVPGAVMPPAAPLGPTLVVPLGRKDDARGVLLVSATPGKAPFTTQTLDLLEPFADQAALALQLAEHRADAERLTLLEDRDRIAADLHDTVIQRLFATAMQLMAALKLTDKPEVARRVQQSVDDLDATIRQIRTAIFSLHQSDEAIAEVPSTAGLRSRLHDVIDAAAAHLGFAPTVALDGALDTDVPTDVADQLTAVITEALSNVARHAHAQHATLTITIGATDQSGPVLTLRIGDDGVGISETGRRSGLTNMDARARRLGGVFDHHPAPGGGTVLTWQVPLRQ